MSIEDSNMPIQAKPYLAFFEENCERGSAEWGWQVRTADVFIRWKNHCEKNDLKMLSSYKNQGTCTRLLGIYVKGISREREWFYGFKLKMDQNI